MDLKEARTARATSSPATRHPWERARCAFVARLVQRFAPTGPVLDVGAGDAFIASALVTTGREVVAVDEHYAADDVARLTHGGLTATTTLPDARRFTVALLCDVIEHVVDDAALLRAAAARVITGGHLIVTVPAWPRLFSAHDRALGHHRRYTPASLDDALRAAGLDVVEGGGLFHGLLVPRGLAVLGEALRPRRVGRRDTGDDVGAVGLAGGFGAPAVVADAITAALTIEQALSRRLARDRPLTRAVPGLSLYAVARVAP